MNFIEAVKAAKAGKLIRLPYWGEEEYATSSIKCTWLLNEIGDRIVVTIHDYLAEDWEVAQ